VSDQIKRASKVRITSLTGCPAPRFDDVAFGVDLGASNQTIEQEIQAKGLTAPRVTLADLEANIADIEIVKHVSKSGQVLRWAVLTTRCGYAAVGKHSCSVSNENDDAELGEKIAIANTKADLWPLMGYALKERLAGQA